MRTLILLALAPAAMATPVQLHHQARVTDTTGAPIQGEHLLTLTLHSDASANSPLFTESFTVTFESGFASVVLGSDTEGHPLDSSALSGEVWVATSIDGTPLDSRSPLLTVPRAAVATDLDGGTVRASQIEITGTGTLQLGTADTACTGDGQLAFSADEQAVVVCVGNQWRPLQASARITDEFGARQWSDGTVAPSCLGYFNGLDAQHPYEGAVGDGLYLIDPDGSGSGTAFPVQCDMTNEGGGWTLLMTATGTTFPYGSSYWTSNNTLNDGSPTTNLSASAKYRSYNELPVNQLRLQAASGNATRLALPSETTLLSLVSTADATNLTVLSGSTSPSHLANSKTFTYCGAAWRVNSGLSGSVVRLGGSYQHYWDCSYGNDGGGPTGAHYAGFGITDTRWGPNTYGSKSFGVRDAHDQNHSNPGQLASQAHIWGR